MWIVTLSPWHDTLFWYVDYTTFVSLTISTLCIYVCGLPNQKKSVWQTWNTSPN